MKGAAFGIILSLIPLSSMAADCFDMAGRDYKIDPDLLRAISWQESRFKIDTIGRNPVTGYGSGLMQIDS
ncbi:TPA: transglycosylase SLT domain-containing protein, partial [Klebsiella pneumoniae]|nr:transglycosylase SLT domain-containing protein [Klebsiella pneumoniae]